MAEGLRVLHLASYPQARGAELFALRLADSLQERGVVNSLCTLYLRRIGDDSFRVQDLAYRGLDGRRTLTGRVLRVEPQIAFRLGRVLRHFNPDIVIGHGSETLKYTSLSGLFRRRAKTVYVNIGVASHWAAGRSRVWFNGLFLRGIDCVVSVSEFTRRDFVQHYGFPASRCVFIPNAVRVEDFAEAASPAVRRQVRSELGIVDSDVAIIVVGSLSRGKGQDALINAMSRLVGRGLPVRLLLAGDGEERNRLMQLAKSHGVEDRTLFLGQRDDVPRLLTGADIFALASTTEGMPGVLIEAGLAGVASVVYDVGGVTEVVQDGITGLVVPPGEFGTFVGRLAELAGNAQRRTEFGQRARARCESRFSLNTVSLQYERLFDQMVAGRALFDVRAAMADQK